MHTTTVPVTYLRQIADQAAELSVDMKDLLSSAELREQDLADSTVHIPVEKFGEFVAQAIQISGETGFGVLAGCRLVTGSHGIVGLAAMTSHNIREAMQLVEQFVCLRTGAVRIQNRIVNGVLEVFFTPALGLGSACDPVIEIAVVAVKNIADDLIPHGSACTRVCFSFPEPPHSDLAHDIFGCEVLYGQSWSGLSFDLSTAEEDASTHDPLVLNEAVRICTEEFKKVRNNASVRARLEGLMLECSPVFPSITTCAKLMGMTPRTLHRRLVAEASSFRDVLESVRHQMALELLRKKVPVKETAYLLNYTDIANFRRAFKRWEGMAPTDWVARCVQ